MTARYVGIGGNDGNSGLTWALRKLTLNGVEDTPVAAGDTVYVGPGVYREQLALDVSGTSGNEIVYIGDVTGENTDGVGGVVRVTGSADDIALTRTECVHFGWPGKNYRTFRSFRFDMASANAINISGQSINWIFEDCVFTDNASTGITTSGDNQADGILRRCIFIGAGQYGITLWNDMAVGDSSHLVENCIFVGFGHWQSAISVTLVDQVTIKNCIIIGAYRGINVTAELTTGTTVNNCAISNCQFGLVGIAVGDILENYNSLFNNGTNRTNTDTGAQSNVYPALINLPIMLDGFQFPWRFGELSEWSQVKAITGNGEPSDDLFGIARPATASKNSWGAVQFADAERDTGTTSNSSTASLELLDAARVQLGPFEVPNASIDIHVKVYRGPEYAGTAPQLVIKQPGASDDTTVDGGSAETWNELKTTLTPNANPSYVYVELVSNNTATADDYKAYFDSLVVNGKVVDFDEWVTDRIIMKDHEAYVRWPRARGHGV